jgi:RNA polymerase sigma factor (sigma-70 family)
MNSPANKLISPAVTSVREMTAGIRAGHEQAFDSFYASYANRMLRYLLVAARGDMQAALDVRQEALLRTIRHVPELQTDEELWRNLVLYMRSSWIDFVRARQREKRHTQPMGEPSFFAPLPQSEEETTDRLHDLLQQSLADLPAADQALLNDHYFSGHSQKDLAQGQGVPEKTLSMRIVRLRRHLRDFILQKLKHD